MKTKTPTTKQIKENLKRVEEGKPLNISLAVLNGEFKAKYKEKVGRFECGSVPHSFLGILKRKCIVCKDIFETNRGKRKVCKECEEEYYKKKAKETRKRRYKKNRKRILAQMKEYNRKRKNVD